MNEEKTKVKCRKCKVDIDTEKEACIIETCIITHVAKKYGEEIQERIQHEMVYHYGCYYASWYNQYPVAKELYRAYKKITWWWFCFKNRRKVERMVKEMEVLEMDKKCRQK